jgi:GrpB-like predicted nucleotidyltransferase (UPF0157 family)
VGPGCTCGKRERQPLPRFYREAKRLWSCRHPPKWLMRTVVQALLRLPPIAGFSVEQFASEVLMSKRSVQRMLRKLESRHCIKRRHAGRGHPLILEINHIAWFQHHMFKGPDTDVNLHVFSAGSAEVGRMLLFRNWLRSNQADRELYARTKRELAHKTWRYVQHYADVKTEVIEAILVRALAARTLGNS